MKVPNHPSKPLPGTSTQLTASTVLKLSANKTNYLKTKKDKKLAIINQQRKHNTIVLIRILVSSLHAFEYDASILAFGHPSFCFTSSHFLNTNLSLPNHHFSSSEH